MTWSHPFPQRVRLLFGSLSPSKFGDEISSFADPGCLSRILDLRSKFFPSGLPDPGSEFFHPGSWIPDLHQRIEVFKKKWGHSSQKYDPGFPSRIRIWILTFYLSPIPILDPRSHFHVSKRHRIADPGSWIRICNTGDFGFAQAIQGSISY